MESNKLTSKKTLRQSLNLKPLGGELGFRKTARELKTKLSLLFFGNWKISCQKEIV